MEIETKASVADQSKMLYLREDSHHSDCCALSVFKHPMKPVFNHPIDIPGERGPPGFTGSRGPTGATGPTGRSGSRGATGPTGRSGATGATGPRGPRGFTGARGSPGLGAAGKIVRQLSLVENHFNMSTSGPSERCRLARYDITFDEKISTNHCSPVDLKH